MLYTESMEIASPLLVRDAKPEARRETWTEQFLNRWTHPRIDLGVCMGTGSVVVSGGAQEVVHPTRVATRESNGKIVALGAQAAEIEGREPEGVEVHRPIVSGVVVNEKLAARLLSSVMSASKHGLLTAPRVAVAVPSDMSAVESQTLLATAKSAGAREVYLVDQAMTAAIGAGRDLMKPEGHLVVHIGAGVTQVAVSSLASPVLSRTLRVAGDSMNEAITHHVRRNHNLMLDDRVADKIKKVLGSALPPVTNTELVVAGRDLKEGKPMERTVNAEEVYQVLKPLLAEIAQEVRWVVASMSTALLEDVTKNGVILSGGCAELHRLDEFLSQETRLKVRVAAEPDGLVARGLETLLKKPALRKAVFNRGQAKAQGLAQDNRKGTGLLGMLLLSSVLAFGASSAPQLQQGAFTSIDQFIGSSITPSAPIAEGWGWHAPDTADTRAFEAARQAHVDQENQQLRELLEAPALNGPGEPIVADVVARDPRGWMSALTLNVGSEDGVGEGMAVSDGSNLVGQVTRVQSNRCQVRLFTDSKAVVAGKLKQARASGVVVGSGGHELEMRYLDPDSGVKSGDWVLTSGHDGVFPAGIRVGQVVRVHQPAEQNYLAAVVKPAVDVNSLENVVVVRG